MKRAKHSLSNYKLLTANMGELVPCGLMEVLPGDTVQHATSALIRCSPLLAPVMHPVQVRIHHWYVPHRLVWEDWEEFITGGPDGMDASVFPTKTFAGGVSVGSLGDYLGIPTGVVNAEVSALPLRGYNKIWNEFYRDQDLQTELVIDEGSGPDTTTTYALQNVAWEKDYLTSARPWEQKGPAITIPLGTTAPVTPDGTNVAPTFSNVGAGIAARSLNLTSGVLNAEWSSAPGASGTANWLDPNLVADISSASAITINLLREAFALQRFQEARARYGSRYVEYLRYLGVRSSDARLQRPEYLGGGKQTIQFSEVLATAEGTNTDVGDMKGHGIGAMRSNRYRRFFEEHGYVFSFITVKPKTMYQQGLSRHWSRRVKEDFWQKELEHIGQQEVMKSEVYFDAATATETFGYQDRYDEYRRTPSTVCGDFRSTLNMWHMGRVFGSAPALNATFVSSNPTERIFADQTVGADHLWIMTNHNIQARRLVSQVANSFIF